MASLKPRKVKKERAARLAGKIEGMPVDNPRHARYYVHYDVEKSQYVKPIVAYIEKKFGRIMAKLIQSKLKKKLTYYAFHATTAYRSLNDLPVEENYVVALDKWILELNEEAKNVVEEVNEEEEVKPVKNTKTIQERITEKAQDICIKLDEFIEGEELDVRAHLLGQETTQAHARKIISIYQQEMQDYVEYVALPTSKLTEEQQQLKEGYSHIKKTEAKKILKLYQTIIDECNMIIDAAKVKRAPRKKKPVSKYKLIEGIKYLAQDPELKLVSENPIGILEATELWVYNVKTRKLGVYKAISGNLSVKGTSIIGYDEVLSTCKTLRKPEEQTKEFKKATKLARNKMYKEIKTKEAKLTGRINKDTILLKIV